MKVNESPRPRREAAVGSGGALPRWDCPTFVSRKTTTEEKDLSPAPRARWGFVREVSPYSSQLGRCPIGRGGVWGCVIALQTPLQFRYPAPRGECESSPQSRLNCALPLGAGAWGGVGSCLGVSQRVPLGVPSRRCVVLRVSPTIALEASHPPRPIGLCPARPQNLPLLVPSSAGRLLRCVRLP